MYLYDDIFVVLHHALEYSEQRCDAVVDELLPCFVLFAKHKAYGGIAPWAVTARSKQYISPLCCNSNFESKVNGGLAAPVSANSKTERGT